MGAIFRDHAIGCHVLASRSLQTLHVPAILIYLEILRRHEETPVLGAFCAVRNDSAEHDPFAVIDAARKAPPPGQSEPVPHAFGLTGRSVRGRYASVPIFAPNILLRFLRQQARVPRMATYHAVNPGARRAS